jgi:S-layer protein
LALNLNNVGTTATAPAIDLGGTYKNLNITTSGAASDLTLTGAGVQALTVTGSKDLDLNATSLTALKTVVASGAAGLKLTATAASVTSFDASASTGAITASVNAANASYAGSAGVDTLTLSTSTIAKSVALGAGDDTLTLAAGTTAIATGGNLSGGNGTDTLAMDAADAETASATAVFETKIDGFEKLSLGQAASALSVNLANMDDISYVISAGGSAGVNGQIERQVLEFTGSTTTSGSIIVGGVTVALANTDTDADISTKVAAALNAVPAGTAIGDAVFTVYTTAPFAYVIADFDAANGNVSNTILSVVNGTATLSQPVNYVVLTEGTAAVAGGTLTLTNVTNAGTLELTAAATTTTVTMTDATGTADSFNVMTKVGAADVTFGTVDVAGVETVNLTATDTAATTINRATLTLTDAAAKNVTVAGNANVTLTAASAVLTSVDASASTGGLTFTSAVNAAVVTGGAGADALTGSGTGQTLRGGTGDDQITSSGANSVLNGDAGNDQITSTGANSVLNGGAGNDQLTGNASGMTLNGSDGNDTLTVGGNLAVLAGGAGNDTYVVGYATSNINNYAIIAAGEFNVGDVLKFADVNGATETFASARVVLNDTAVFQDYANAVINSNDAGAIAWFQFAGNTYVVEHASPDNSLTFVEGTDVLVRITGLVDLSTASFNASSQTLQLV